MINCTDSLCGITCLKMPYWPIIPHLVTTTIAVPINQPPARRSCHRKMSRNYGTAPRRHNFIDNSWIYMQNGFYKRDGIKDGNCLGDYFGIPIHHGWGSIHRRLWNEISRKKINQPTNERTKERESLGRFSKGSVLVCTAGGWASPLFFKTKYLR